MDGSYQHKARLVPRLAHLHINNGKFCILSFPHVNLPEIHRAFQF